MPHQKMIRGGGMPTKDQIKKQLKKRSHYLRKKEHYKKYNREYKILWRQKNRDAYNAYQREYYHKNKQKRLDQKKQYQDKKRGEQNANKKNHD